MTTNQINMTNLREDVLRQRADGLLRLGEIWDKAHYDALLFGAGIVRVERIPAEDVYLPASTERYGCHDRLPITTFGKQPCQFTLSPRGPVDPRCHGCKERANSTEVPKENP